MTAASDEQKKATMAPEGEAPQTKPAKPPVTDEGIFAELWDFMRVRKKFWLAPILIALVLLGMLFFFAQTAGVVSPFIYAL